MQSFHQHQQSSCRALLVRAKGRIMGGEGVYYKERLRGIWEANYLQNNEQHMKTLCAEVEIFAGARSQPGGVSEPSYPAPDGRATEDEPKWW